MDIVALDLAGDGLAEVDDGALVVPFTIPGERVRVQVDRHGRASLLTVLRASPYRVAPACSHFGPAAADRGGICGGCRWQHIAYAEQLRLKTALINRVVGDAVRGAPAAAPTLAGTPIDQPWGFRQKVHFVFGSAATGGRGERRALVMGHYARGSRRVVPVHECPVHDRRGNALAFTTRDACLEARVAPGAIGSVAIRVGADTGERLLTIVAPDDRDRRVRRATERAIAAGAPTGVHLNLHPEPDAFIFGPETRRLHGAARLREQVAGTSFLISPTAFFQTNVAAASLLARTVLDAVPPGARVLDLYAGAGLFALPLAQAGHVVTAVEENRDAVADGEASQRLNRIPGAACRFIAAPVEQALRRIRDAEAVVLDPPREGCSPPVLDEVFGRLRPGVAIYVSCNPAVLGRDLNRMTRHGYRVVRIQPVDMFPHTPHVETVVVLRKGLCAPLSSVVSV